MILHQILQCLALSHLALSVSALGKSVNTTTGPIVGTHVVYNTKTVAAFLGIPFAEPPLGGLRFRKPVPKKPWSRTLQATTLPPACLQHTNPVYPWTDPTRNQKEDCLYLNIWVPPNTCPNSKKAVMFWIFSGGFALGSGRLPVYDGHVLAAEGDVIVVTINYRLNILGFLSSTSDEAPGNMGFYDMVEALKWVRANIKRFGGDPDNVTVFGQSAGGISAGLFCMSPLTKRMFQKAILQSGSPAYTANDNRAMNTELAKKVAEKVGCGGVDTLVNQDKMIQCFRRKRAKRLVEVTSASHQGGLVGFSSIVGDEFIPTEPHAQLISGAFNDVKVMIGFVQDEAPFGLALINKEQFGVFGKKNPHTNKTLGANSIREALQFVPEKELVVQYYLGNVSDADFGRIRLQSYHAIGDYILSCPVIYFAESYSRKGLDVYAYYFNHVPSVNPWARWMGVVHFSEVAFVFGRPLDHPKDYTRDERKLSLEMVQLWSNFAKTGSPGGNWQKYSRSNPTYKVFNINNRQSYLPTLRENCDFYRPIIGFP